MLKASIALSTLLISTIVFANVNVVRGVNYDPVHSFEFARAVGLDDAAGMQAAISADFDKLAQLQNYNNNQFQTINHIKTFFTVFSSAGLNGPMVNINIADVVNHWNQQNPNNKLTLALGVYEFRPSVDSCKTSSECIAWTQAQVQGAIAAANQYGAGLIDKIIVGNEDINANLNDSNNMLTRVTNDINTIKASINDKNIEVGTAQTANAVSEVFSTNSYNDLKNAADFIGANVYPYWGGAAYGTQSNSPAKNAFASYWQSLAGVKSMKLIETEEGWPSAGYNVGNAVPSPNSEHDYFYYWFYRDTATNAIVPESYFFALFDKLPGQGTESNWGIFSADGNASILDGDFSKPLAANHAVPSFINIIEGNRVAAINACTQDWDNGTQSQGTCFPLFGFPGTGDVSAGVKSLMLDTSGKTYTSLLVVYHGDSGQMPRLCYINNQALRSITSKSKIILDWKNAAGNVPCEIE